MSTFQWDKNFETGLQDVDEQHLILVNLMNRFSALLEGGSAADVKVLERICEELAEYARYHFSEEQMFMDETGVDRRHSVRHAREHADFIHDLARMRTEVVAGVPEAARHLLEFLVHWLTVHILGSDQCMARQIAAMSAGRSPAAAFAQEERAVDGATGVLLRSLSSLIMVVSERSRALSELNYTLENRVFRRTQELSLLNERLTGTVERFEAEQKETRRLAQELAEANKRLEALAMVDPLTGLPNLQYALNRLNAEIASSKHFGHPLSVALFAVEGFKEANDALGHAAGDDILQAVGVMLRMGFRSHDVVCHVGVEEFLVICPLTNYAGTIFLIERIRASLPGKVVQTCSGEWKNRLSAGIAEFGPEADSVNKLLQVATRRRWPLEPVPS
ncbi:MAG: diguanylate cyclase [Holophagaceae bacterium]|uniref:diguanylate cyclase n=1 Tax=Candidatus Geothrix skivensis TaxID=2954439 RepID=A0A9D7SJ23_9BACT|nr:diguanylate cyclase [Candidatus Geothrix skivensis]